MAKRLGRTVISVQAASEYRFEQLSRGSDHANMAGNCQSPVMLPFTGVTSETLAKAKWSKAQTDDCPWQDWDSFHGWHLPTFGSVRQFIQYRHVDVAVRCRKCAACLRARAFQWQQRAQYELAIADRTWFATFTLRPEEHFRHLSLARQKYDAEGGNLDNASDAEIFKARCKPLIREFQLYMKRVRKSAAGLRFMLVIEKHKTGLPHLHAFIHEAQNRVTHKTLTNAWHLGFTTFKLVDSSEPQAARYITKYLTKSVLNRLCASSYYGKLKTDR